MKELLTYILAEITGEAVEIEESENSGRVDFKISPKSEYAGIIIGKGGRTIKSILRLIRVKATLENKLVYLTVSSVEGVGAPAES